MICVVLLLTSTGTWALLEQTRLHMARSRLAVLHESHSQQTPMVESAEGLKATLEWEIARDELRNKVAGGAKLNLVLAELSRRLPRSVYLNSLSIQRKDRLRADTPEGDANTTDNNRAEVPRLNILLSGHAFEDADIGKMVNALSESELFEEVKLNYSSPRVVGEHRVSEFEIRCRLPQFL